MKIKSIILIMMIILLCTMVIPVLGNFVLAAETNTVYIQDISKNNTIITNKAENILPYTGNAIIYSGIAIGLLCITMAIYCYYKINQYKNL